jgi:hypothetical protein
MPDPEYNSTLNQDGQEEQPAMHGDGDWFEPVLSPSRKYPAPKPAPKAKPRSFTSVIDEVFAENGWPTTPSTPLGSTLPDSASIVATEDSDPTPVTTQGTSRSATATEIFNWIKMVLLSETHLSNEQAGLVTFWVISTWLQPALAILPCLVITGAAYDATRVLHLLQFLCCRAALLGGFERSHLLALRHCLTNLVSEPCLNKRTANLLSSLTDGKCLVVAGSSLGCFAKSTAIYTGENPEMYRIDNRIHIHVSRINAEPPTTSSPQLLQRIIQGIPTHLEQYREKYLHEVQLSSWVPSGLSSEMATMAAELGRCIVDAPELRQKLVALLKIQGGQRLSDLSNTNEAVALLAILNLYHQGKPEFLAGEIATEFNRIQKSRGELLIGSAEKIGHLLKKVGLHTRRSSAGMRLVMDRSTIAQVHKLAAVYGGVGLEEKDNNLHCQLCADTEPLM